MGYATQNGSVQIWCDRCGTTSSLISAKRETDGLMDRLREQLASERWYTGGWKRAYCPDCRGRGMDGLRKTGH